MLKSFNSILTIIAILATAFVVTLNEYNIQALKQDTGSNSKLVQTADDLSYTMPPQNYLSNGVWKDNRESEISYVMRPPGYGSVILISSLIAPDDLETAQKAIQVLFFFLAILLFGKILQSITESNRVSLVGAALFAFLPCYQGFVYYSITEAVTPFLLLLLTFFFLSSLRRNSRWYTVGFIFAAGVIFITRIQLIIFPFTFIFILILSSRKQLWVLASLIPLILWQLRVHHYTGKYNLHPIYSSSNTDEFRPPHKALTELFKIWEYRSDNFHGAVQHLSNGTDSTNLNAALSNVPKHLHNEVKPVLSAYQELRSLQEITIQNDNLVLLNEPEQKFVRYTELTTQRIASSNIGLAYISTPLKSLSQFFNKSYLNLYLFQKEWRGMMITEILRTLCFALILISFIAVLLTNFMRLELQLTRYLSFPILATLLYLIFVQRLNEERYLVPILPIALIVLMTFIEAIRTRKKLPSPKSIL